jgi:two-component system, sensor histidine kinase
VSDYRLPGPANGIIAIGQLRDLLGRPLPACVISGDMDARAHQQAQAAGLTWLQKPVRPAKLRSVLRSVVRDQATESAAA